MGSYNMQVLPELKFLQLQQAQSTAVSEWIELVQAALWLQTLHSTSATPLTENKHSCTIQLVLLIAFAKVLI